MQVSSTVAQAVEAVLPNWESFQSKQQQLTQRFQQWEVDKDSTVKLTVNNDN